MKKLYFSIVAIVLFNFYSFSAPVITAISTGYWNSASTWNLSRLPQVGDTIVIPAGYTVTIRDDEKFNGFVYLEVNGILTFQYNNSTLSLDASSTIMVSLTGVISGGGSASQKIRLNNQVIFQGNDGSIIGPQVASATSSGFSFLGTSSVLPVKFVGFTLTGKDNDVYIQWSASEQINAGRYEVDRSFDAVNWSTLSYVSASGNSSAINNYSYLDKNVSAAVIYYRVKQIDHDGKITSTGIKSIKSVAGLSTEIKIAVVSKKVLVEFEQQMKGKISVRFVSLNGQVIDQQILTNPIGQVTINSKVSGNYIISISNGQSIAAKQVIL